MRENYPLKFNAEMFRFFIPHTFFISIIRFVQHILQTAQFLTQICQIRKSVKNGIRST
jgi:hypothetical protein